MTIASPGMRLANAMSPWQYLLLSTLVLYTSGLSFLMHRSRQAEPGKGLYSVPASIFCAELLKLIVSVVMSYRANLGYIKPASKNRYDRLEQGDHEEEAAAMEKINGGSSTSIHEQKDDDEDGRRSPIRNQHVFAFNSVIDTVLAPGCWKLGVPAVLYVAQNLLQLASFSVVSPVTYQALSQFKLLATTLLSSIILSRRYSREQWISIFVLLFGVIMVSSSKIKNKKAKEEDGFMIAKLIGVMGVLGACTLGSGAAVYMEKVLKSDKKTSLWIRNAQLSLFSLVPATIALLYDQSSQGRWYPLQWFTTTAWLVVLGRSIAGFLIALILQQTDSILKGIATSVAMVLSILIESVILHVSISTTFGLGALLVVCSSASYIYYGLPK